MEREVVEAAKNADIHERILTFPDLYNTQVSLSFPSYLVFFFRGNEIEN